MIEFNLSLFGIIGIGLATMFFGYFFGLFEGRGQGYKRRRKEEALEHALEDQTKVALAKGVGEASPPGAGQPASSGPRLLELTSESDGRPRIVLDGQAVARTAITASQRKRLVELMVLMRPWIEGVISGNEAPSAGPPAARPSAVAPPPPSRVDTARVPPASPAPAEPPAAAAEPAAPLSMVSQIDAILQARLAGTPLAERGIRLTEALNGGVNVFVGVDRFESIADVHEAEIQAAIRSAIAEWEQKYTPS